MSVMCNFNKDLLIMTPSIVHDVRDILLIKGLDDPYVSEKMSGFDNIKTNFEALAKASFLDQEGRMLLTERVGLSLNDLNVFFKVSERFYR